MRTLLAIIIVAITGQPALAGGYGYGYSNYGSYCYPSYTYYNYPSYGYGGYYTPSYTYYPSWTVYCGRYYPPGYYYWYNGCWYLQGQVGPYYGYATPPADYPGNYEARTVPTAPTAPAYSGNWKTDILRMSEKRDDHAAYLIALDKAGLQKPLAPGYAFGPYNQTLYTGGMAYPNFGPFGVNGSTVYGYTPTYNQVTTAAAIGAFDTNLAFQQGSRLVELAGTTFNSGIDKVQQTIRVGVDGNSRVAEALARGQTAVSAIQAASQLTNASGSSGLAVQSQTITAQTTGGVGGIGSPPPAPPNPQPNPQPDGVGAQPPITADAVTADAQTFLTAVVQPQCGSCHSGQAGKGKFRVEMVPVMSRASWRAVLQRITTRREDIGMPRNGSKHAPLTDEQLQAWFAFQPRGN